MLPRQRPIGLLPGIDAALNVAGGLEAGVLRGLYRHRGALAEGAVEHNPLAGPRGQFMQHAAASDVLLQVRKGRVQRAGNGSVSFAFALLAQVDDRDVGAAVQRHRLGR